MSSSIRKLARHEAARVSKLIYLITDLITALVFPIFPLNLKIFSANFFWKTFSLVHLFVITQKSLNFEKIGFIILDDIT